MNSLIWALVKRSLDSKRGAAPALAAPGETGFTLLEVLVVIVIISLLSAIALPAFLSQASRANQANAQAYIGAINRAQQAYRMDSPTFANKIEILDAGIPVETERYSYTITVAEGDRTVITATPKDNLLSGYAGVVYLNTDAAQNVTMTTEVCEGGLGMVPNLTFTPTPTGLLLSGC